MQLEGYYGTTHLLFGGEINKETAEILSSTLADLALIKGTSKQIEGTLTGERTEESSREDMAINTLKRELYNKLFIDIEQQWGNKTGKILVQVPLSHAADFIPELIARKTDPETCFSQLDIEYVIIDSESIAGISGNEDEVRRLYNYYLKKIEGADKFIQIVDTADANSTFVDPEQEQQGLKRVASDFQSALNKMGENRQNKMRLYFPTEEMAAKENMTLQKFYELYLKATSLNWARMKEANSELAELMREYDSVSIKGPGTDISYNIASMGARNSVIQTNWPGTEVHTAPQRTGVNGYITYDNEVYVKMLGETIPGITFRFTDGKLNFFEILETNLERKRKLSIKLGNLFNEAEGNKYLGELAFGTNFFVPIGIKHPLIGEKALGMHMAFGKSYNYEGVDNGNNDGGGIKTSFHWDVIKDMCNCIVTLHKEGKDDMVIMNNSKFNPNVLPQLGKYQQEIDDLI